MTDDPFGFEDLLRGHETMANEQVIWIPRATYPIHVRGLGGRSVDSARALRDDLNQAILAATGKRPMTEDELIRLIQDGDNDEILRRVNRS